jgi:hypothetical protein
VSELCPCSHGEERATLTPTPAALCRDAKARGLVVWDADAQTLFPDVAYFRKPQQQQQQQQPQQQGRHEPEEDVDPLLWRQQQEEVERPVRVPSEAWAQPNPTDARYAAPPTRR